MTERMTNVEIVRHEMVVKKTPRWQLRYHLELDRKQINTALRSLVKSGEVHPVSPKRVEPRKKEVRKFAVNEEFSLIQPFAEIGMTAAEVQFALKIERGVKLTTSQARESIHTARKRNKIRNLSPEEKLDTLKNSHISREEIEANTKQWLKAIKQAENLNLNTGSWTRVDWKAWIAQLEVPKRQIETGQYMDYVGENRITKVQQILAIKVQQKNLREVERREIQLALDMINGGLVIDNSYNERVVNLFRDKLESFSLAFGIHLEGLWRARAYSMSDGDDSMFQKYLSIGRNIDRIWFAGEELNLARKLISSEIRPPEKFRTNIIHF